MDLVGWLFALQALAFPATVDGTAAAAVALCSAYVAAASLTGREAEASLAGVPFAFFFALLLWTMSWSRSSWRARSAAALSRGCMAGPEALAEALAEALPEAMPEALPEAVAVPQSASRYSLHCCEALAPRPLCHAAAAAITSAGRSLWADAEAAAAAVAAKVAATSAVTETEFRVA